MTTAMPSAITAASCLRIQLLLSADDFYYQTWLNLLNLTSLKSVAPLHWDVIKYNLQLTYQQVISLVSKNGTNHWAICLLCKYLDLDWPQCSWLLMQMLSTYWKNCYKKCQ
jgi:hypothetical protein